MTNEIERFFNNTIGFHPIIRRMNEMDSPSKFPPTNISSIKDEDGNTHTLVELALAGWSKEELGVTFGDNRLTVEGTHIDNDEDVVYHHKGIAKRAFTWTRVVPADYVMGDVTLNDGILSIELSEVIPEERMIKQIPIN